MVSYIHTYEVGLPHQHPVGISPILSNGGYIPNSTLIGSNADWYSSEPSSGDASLGVESASPPLNSTKPGFADTDHIRPNGADIDVWAWRAFIRGYNVIHMDDLGGVVTGGGALAAGDITGPDGQPYDVKLRRGMKQVSNYAARCDLRTTVAHDALASPGFCIANPGTQYLALAPSGGTFTVDLSAGSGHSFTVEWLKVTDLRFLSAPIRREDRHLSHSHRLSARLHRFYS